MKRNYKKHEFTNEDFVKLWKIALDNKAGAGWIARQLNIDKSNVYTYAKKLRSLGVDLPSLAQNRDRFKDFDVDKLNKIIRGE